MLALLALSALFSGTLADSPCICALFAEDQFGPGGGQQQAIPLVREVLSEGNECTVPSEASCADACAIWMQDAQDNGVNQCRDGPTFADRCYGSFWCEILGREGVDGPDMVLSAYARLNCTILNDWVQTGYSAPNTLCCDAGIYTEDCRPIGCDCVQGDYTCECGLFTDWQFQPNNLKPGETPLPLRLISLDSSNFTEEERTLECLAFPGSESLCSQLCTAAADAFLPNFTLCDPHPKDNTLTYGQAYCQALRARSRGTFQGCDEALNVLARAPQCFSIGWDRGTIYGTHIDTLLCDADGNFIGKCPRRPS